MPQTKPIHKLVDLTNPSGLSGQQLAYRLGRSNPPYTLLVTLAASGGTIDIRGAWNDAAGILDFVDLAGKARVGATVTEWVTLTGVSVTVLPVLIVIEYPLTAIRVNVTGLTATGNFVVTLIHNE